MVFNSQKEIVSKANFDLVLIMFRTISYEYSFYLNQISQILNCHAS
jgi:hypothetical protein